METIRPEGSAAVHPDTHHALDCRGWDPGVLLPGQRSCLFSREPTGSYFAAGRGWVLGLMGLSWAESQFEAHREQNIAVPRGRLVLPAALSWSNVGNLKT